MDIAEQADALCNLALDLEEQGADSEMVEKVKEYHSEAVSRRKSGNNDLIDLPDEIKNLFSQQAEKRASSEIDSKLAELVKAAGAQAGAEDYFRGRVSVSPAGELILRRHDGTTVELTISAIASDLPDSLVDRRGETAEQFHRRDLREQLEAKKEELRQAEAAVHASRGDNTCLRRCRDVRQQVQALENEIEQDREKQRERYAPPAEPARTPTPAEINELKNKMFQLKRAEEAYRAAPHDTQRATIAMRLRADLKKYRTKIGA